MEERRAEVQVPRIRSRAERTRPGVAARRPIAERRIVPIVGPASYICEWKSEEGVSLLAGDSHAANGESATLITVVRWIEVCVAEG